MRVAKHATLRMGMIYVPIGVCTSARRQDITFVGLHKGCGGRKGEKNYCKACDEMLEAEQIEKGFELAKDQYVTFSEAELEQFKPERTAIIDITKFVPRDELEPEMIETMYWLQPNKALLVPYELLATSMAETGMIAIGRTTLWGKEHPFAIDVDGGVLSMKLLFCFDELISSNEIRATLTFDLDAEERDLFKQVISMKSGTIEVEDLTNISREHGYELIAAKSDGKEISIVEKVEAPKATISIKETLEAMVAAG